MMRSLPWLICSFALVLSLVLIGKTTSQDAAGPVTSESATPVSCAATDAEASKLTALARIEQAVKVQSTQTAPAYWQADQELDRLKRNIAREDRLRLELRNRYGAAAEREPLFARAFRPLDLEYPFLSSAEQIRLQRVLVDFRADAKEDTTLGWDEFRQRLAEFLDAGTLLEYELRQSPLAADLRSSGIGFNEYEFREAFRILSAFEARPPTAGDLLDLRSHLRTLLGEERFTRYWASRDSRFEAIRRAARRHNLPSTRVWEVFAIINDAQDSLLELMRTPADDASSAQRIERLRREVEHRIERLVGARAAQDILQADARALFTWSMGGSR
jgi:hypothetical protein